MLLKPGDEFMAAYERAEENELRHANTDDDEKAAKKRRRRTALAVGGGVAAGAAITAAVMKRRPGGATPAPAPKAVEEIPEVEEVVEAAEEDGYNVIRPRVKGRTIKRNVKPGVKYHDAPRAHYVPYGYSDRRLWTAPTPRDVIVYQNEKRGLKSGMHYKMKKKL